MFLFLACAEPDDEAAPVTEATPEAPIVVTLNPPELDFGTVTLGVLSTQTVQVTNAGTAPITLSGATVADETLTLDVATNTLLAPGMSSTITLEWTPSTPAVLDDTLEVLVSAESGAFEQVPAAVTGTAAGPMLALSATSADFGTLSVGCTGVVPLVITNTGNGDLTVSSLAFADDSEVTITAQDGELGAYPWILAPYASARLNLTYTPTDEETYANILQILSDDPNQPELQLPLLGEALIEEENAITYEVEPKQYLTVLFAMNEVVSTGQYHERFTDALPVFFEALLDYGAPFRVAFSLQLDGSIQGDIPYIDETYDPSEVADISEGMAATGMGDNDYLLQALLDGIDANYTWLFDETDVHWEESRLSLVGMNSDQEQSSGTGATFVADYLVYKEDSADIVVHGIGGDVPRGCGGSAEAFLPFYDAAALTGGAFLSICETDWTTHMSDLAAAVIGDAQVFELTGEPAEWSIEVWVDGARLNSGWTYDATLKQVLFDDEQLVGAEIRITYIMAAECPSVE